MTMPPGAGLEHSLSADAGSDAAAALSAAAMHRAWGAEAAIIRGPSKKPCHQAASASGVSATDGQSSSLSSSLPSSRK
eukprot:9059864-Pyramimonas_sp.AAC.1